MCFGLILHIRLTTNAVGLVHTRGTVQMSVAQPRDRLAVAIRARVLVAVAAWLSCLGGEKLRNCQQSTEVKTENKLYANAALH